MKRVSCNYKKEAWVFKGDLVGFFMSIDKDLLWYLLERFMKRWKVKSSLNGWRFYGLDDMPEMYWNILFRVTRQVVMHHPEDDCMLNTPPSMWERYITPNKSLFTSPTGEPIGNLTTQLFANFLMSYFVAYVQWLFRRNVFGMAQFVDDFALVCDDKDAIKRNIPKIEAFLESKLKLKMHRNKRYLQQVSHGVLFVGTFIKPNRLYLSGATLARMKQKMLGFSRMLDEGGFSEYTLVHIEQTLNSYLGFCRRRRTYRFRKKMIDGLGSGFWKHFYVVGHYEKVRIKRKYRTI